MYSFSERAIIKDLKNPKLRFVGEELYISNDKELMIVRDTVVDPSPVLETIHEIKGIQLSEDGKFLLLSSDGSMTVHELGSKSQVHIPKGNGRYGQCDCGESNVLVVDSDYSVALFNKNGKLLKTSCLPIKIGFEIFYLSHTDQFCTLGVTGKISLFSRRKYDEIWSVYVIYGIISCCLRLGPNRLCVASTQGEIVVFDLKNKKEEKRFVLLKSKVTSLAVTLDQKYLFASYEHGFIVFSDFADGKILYVFRISADKINDMIVSPCGRNLVISVHHSVLFLNVQPGFRYVVESGNLMIEGTLANVRLLDNGDFIDEEGKVLMKI